MEVHKRRERKEAGSEITGNKQRNTARNKSQEIAREAPVGLPCRTCFFALIVASEPRLSNCSAAKKCPRRVTRAEYSPSYTPPSISGNCVVTSVAEGRSAFHELRRARLESAQPLAATKNRVSTTRAGRVNRAGRPRERINGSPEVLV